MRTALRKSLLSKVALSTFLAGVGLATSATSCGFHNYAPQPTLIDRLFGSDDIVLARPSPDNPFRYEAFKAFEGPLETVEIPFLVDSNTRTRFALNPEAAVLFARDGTYGPWQRIVFVDVAMAPVLDTIMAQLERWQYGEDLERFSYFATLIGHPDETIHKLALRELDQADYSILRQLTLQVDKDRLLEPLNGLYDVDFKAIRILLLGLSGEASLRPVLARGVEESLLADGRFLGAFATALIELEGPDAVAHLTSTYLTDRSVPLLARELIVEALALQSLTDQKDLQDTITQAIEGVLWIDADLSWAVARQFGARANWSFAPALQAVMDAGTVYSAAERQDISQYLEIAKQVQ